MRLVQPRGLPRVAARCDLRADGHVFFPVWKFLFWGMVACAMLLGCSGEKPENQLASAKKYLAQNDSKAAYIQLKNALQASPDSAEARFLLGKLMLDGGDFAASVVELRNARASKYPDDAVIPLLAKALLSAGQDKKLTEEFASVSLTESTAMADLQTSLAIAYLIQDRHAPAESALADAFRASADYVPALIVQTRDLADRGDVPDAFKVLETARAKAPEDPDVWQLQGDLLWSYKRDAQGATDAYRKAIAKRPDSLAAYAAIVTIELAGNNLEGAKADLDSLRKVRPDHPKTHYLAGRLALQQGNLDAASETAAQLLKFAPDNAEFLQFAGLVAAKRGSSLQAEQFLRKALQISPQLVASRRALTRIYTESGQAESALSTALPLLEQGREPDAGNAIVVALAYLQNGNLKKAEELFAVAQKLKPTDTASRTALAAVRLSGNAGDPTALAELDAIARADSGIGADLTLLANYLSRQDTARALQTIDRLEQKQPDKPLASNLRGRVLLSRGDVAGARRSFERALSLDPSFFAAIDSLVMLDLQDNKPELAERRLEELVNRVPTHWRGWLTLARVRAGAGKSPEEVVALIQKAVAADPAAAAPRVGLVDFHLERKEFKPALDAATVASTALPNSLEILDALARAQMAAGDVNQAISTYGKLVALRPKVPQFHAALAGAQVVAKNKVAAMQSLKQTLLLAPDFAPAQRQSIALLQADGNHEAAMAIARSVQKAHPESALGDLYQGDIEAFQKHWQAAATAYRIAMTKASGAGAAQRLHSVLLAGGNRAEANAVADTWQAKHPRDPDFAFYLADVALASRDYATARSLLERVVALQPANAEAHNNLSWVLSHVRAPAALEHAETANRLSPNQPAFMDTWANALADQGRLGPAIDLERRALTLEPAQPGRRLALARFLVKSGDKEAARRELGVILDLGGEGPEVREAKLMSSAL